MFMNIFSLLLNLVLLNFVNLCLFLCQALKEEGEEGHTITPAAAKDVPEISSNIPIRKSSRQIKPPGWTKDFVVPSIKPVANQKYTLELLQEAGVMSSKPYKLPMDLNLKLQAEMGTPLQDPQVNSHISWISKKQGLHVSRSSAEVQGASNLLHKLGVSCSENSQLEGECKE
ncbi:hypothetical protein Tco_1098221 [Tanacetum coccineum]